jgi:hypothetical protein
VYLIIEQQVKCKHCGLIFKEDDILEIDYFLLNTLRKKELSSNINFYIKSVAIQKQDMGY